jgi:hypothetical protein
MSNKETIDRLRREAADISGECNNCWGKMKTRYPAVKSPFNEGQLVFLKTGEKGTAYKDGWDNMAYLHDNGIVYLYFLPYRAKNLDRVISLPITDFVTE